MPRTVTICIYCANPINLDVGEGDHVVPAVFGEFKGQFLFRRICRMCNSTLGKCEEQMTRCAPEAVFRRIVGPVVAKRQKRRGSGWAGAPGSRPPKFAVEHSDHSEIATPSSGNPNLLEPVNQLVVIDDEQQSHTIRLYPQMTSENLKQKFRDAGIKTSGTAYLHCDHALWEHYVAVVKGVWPKSEAELQNTLPVGTHQVKGSIQFDVGPDYWRAIAKIAFHYFLLNSKRGYRGNEPEFAGIRRFIIEGGDHRPFFGKPSTEFRTIFHRVGDGAVVPGTWLHGLAGDDSKPQKTAMVSLFMGPRYLAPVYHVSLGTVQSLMCVRGATFAHEYAYTPDAKAPTYAGVVKAISLTRIR